jgi:cytidyltransferase-like protein
MIVLANGCFDLFHYGHLLHLQAAAKMGTLYVAITLDRNVNKGNGRPVFTHVQRHAIISALRCVHEALFFDSVLDAMELWKPTIFVKGIEYAGKIEPAHRKYCEEHRITIAFTDTPRWSSTDLLHYYDRLRQS